LTFQLLLDTNTRKKASTESAKEWSIRPSQLTTGLPDRNLLCGPAPDTAARLWQRVQGEKWTTVVLLTHEYKSGNKVGGSAQPGCSLDDL
jgi:hypothetical protein